MSHPATVLFALLVLVATLSGCGSASDTEQATESARPGSPTTSVPPASCKESSEPSNPVSPNPAEAVATAAEAFLAELSPAERERVLYEVEDPAVREWFYFPSTDERNGVALGDLTAEQRSLALEVAQAVLSESGFSQLQGVLAAEDALGVRNGTSAVTSDRYFLAFFGSPSADQRFAVQINGHHLAVNHTYEAGQVSPTPAFTGVDPVDFEVGGERVRPMLAKTEAVAGLFAGMGEEDLSLARIEPIDDVRVGTGEDDRYPDPAGMLASELTVEQRESVMAVAQAWVSDTSPQVAEQLMERYRSDLNRTRVAWSGSTDPDTPGSYLRLDGPRLWIEFSNVGRFGNGDNHYHSVYRDKAADYLDSGTP